MDNKIKEHFKSHNKSEVFQTSDGFLFHKDFDANAHARSLKDKTVKRFERGSVEAEKPETTTAEKSTAGDTGAKAEKKPKTPDTKTEKAPAAVKKAGKASKEAKASKDGPENNTNPDAAGESENA